jgi:hypothetical protein
VKERFLSFFTRLATARQEEILHLVLTHKSEGRKLRDIAEIPHGEQGFDFDIVDGAGQEGAVQTLLTAPDKCELKSDYTVSETQNVAIEFECRGKPSGISATEASHWALRLSGATYRGDVIVILDTRRLRYIAENHSCRITDGGDGGVAKMYLVPVTRLVMPIVNMN